MTQIKKTFHVFTETVGDSIIPKGYRRHILNLLNKADIKQVPYFAYGITVYFLIIISSLTSLFLLNTDFFANTPLLFKVVLSPVLVLVSFLALLFTTISLYYMTLKARSQRKIRQMEEVFPEFLAELSLNLKAGESLTEALGRSTEPEFGPLTDEIQSITKKVELGMGLEDAIKEFTNSYDSEIIRETFDLILMGWRKGTRTTKIVDRIFYNLELTRHLRKKVIASVSNYRIFLSFVTLLVAPAMFALSYSLINLIRTLTSQLLIVSSNPLFPFTINMVRINDAHFILFSSIALVITSISAAIIISLIKTGTAEEGYKRIAVFSVITLLMYRAFLFGFTNFFAYFAKT